MSRVYATEDDTGRRFLARIECDENGCDAKILPGPDIGQSGWVKCGGRDGDYTWENDYCVDHAHRVPVCDGKYIAIVDDKPAYHQCNPGGEGCCGIGCLAIRKRGQK